MVCTRASDEYIKCSLIYTTDPIFPILPVKNLVNQDGEATTPYKLVTATKPSVSIPCVLFNPCVVQKATAHVDTKSLKMCHQSQKGFWGIFVVVPRHKKGYLTYVPSTGKILY